MLPFAITMMVVAPLSARIVERIGSKVTVATGLSLAAIGLVLFTGLTVDTAYIDIAWRFVILAMGMALVMAPATDSVMGSLPLAKAGVGSAVNDTTRQVGGALGVAIIGSLLSSIYATRVGDAIPAGAPAQVRAAATDSVGGALAAFEFPDADLQGSGYVSAAELAGWYARATILAFPSLDEGFGIPVLEAMAAGVPVITSDRSALTEVAGDAALRVNPESVEELVEGLRKMAADTTLREDLARKGLARAAEFTWPKAVENTWRIYRELL
jgi:MFS family permease